MSPGLWMWDRSHSHLDTRWGQGSSLGRPVPSAAAGLKQSWADEMPEEFSFAKLSVLRIMETCINPGNKLRKWKGVNWSLNIQGLRITVQDMHVDALWLLSHETRGRAGLKGGSGLDIRSCSGLRTVCATYSRFCLPQTWVDALKSQWGGLRGRETAKQSETASFKWRLGEFSLTGRLC